MNILDREYIPAKLHDCGGRLKNSKGENADWYVYYSVLNPETDEMHRCSKRGRINYLKSAVERRKEGRFLVKYINQRLAAGKLIPEAFQEYQPKEPPVELIVQLRKECSLKKHLKRRTWQSYEYVVNQFEKWMIRNNRQHIMPENLTSADAKRYSDYLISEKSYAGKTHNYHIQYLSVLFNVMIGERDMIKINPWNKVKKLKEIPQKHVAFTESEKEKLNARLLQNNFRLFFFKSFIYYCGLRPIETTMLTVKDVRLDMKKVMIYGSDTKNSQQIGVDIPDQFYNFIIENIGLEKYPDHYYLFGSHTGLEPGENHIHRNRMSSLHSEVLNQMGFSDDYTMYSWRHTGAVAVYNIFKDPYKVMRFLRHSNLQTTMIYLRSMGLLRDEEFISRMK